VRRGWRRIGILAVGALFLVAVVAPASPATAKKRKIDVRPGPNAISKALARADRGDMLRLHGRRYREAVTIEESVKLVGVGRRRPVIDARCESSFTVAVRADNVSLKRLEVRGADGVPSSEVDFRRVSGGRASNLLVRDSCDAEYGINVVDTGPVTIVNSLARGFSDAGFYVGEVTSTPGGQIRVAQSDAFDNRRGVIVENSAGGEIVIERNFIHDNRVPIQPTGVFIHNSDGVRVLENEITRNGIGLHLDQNSDGNSALFNSLLDNEVDIRDRGTGNCGTDNAFSTGDPLPPC
jgi:nitrous oxidase accessory protein NosD